MLHLSAPFTLTTPNQIKTQPPRCAAIIAFDSGTGFNEDVQNQPNSALICETLNERVSFQITPDKINFTQVNPRFSNAHSEQVVRFPCSMLMRFFFLIYELIFFPGFIIKPF